MEHRAEVIIIEVDTEYVAPRSRPEQARYAFAYTITIRNRGEEPVQLLSRTWLITDGNGKQTEVEGEGVVGQQPHIAPGDSYRYSSGTLLDTPLGTMQGAYQLETASGDRFTAPIPVFRLAIPNILN